MENGELTQEGNVMAARGDARPPQEGNGSERRRRSQQKHKHHRRRHHEQSYSMEGDRRRYHWKVLFVTIPTVLLVVGFVVWVLGLVGQSDGKNTENLIKLGQWFVGIGIGVLVILYLRSLWKKLEDYIYELRHPPQDTGLNWEHDHRRRKSKRRRHRSDYRESSSGFKAE